MRPQFPDYGVFTHWPDAGRTLIHPDDMAIAVEVIPSNRVFRRTRFDGVFYHLDYGRDLAFRIRPCMWLKLTWEGFDIGDQVEVSGLGMIREPFVARIVEMRFEKKSRRIEYTLDQAGKLQPRIYLADELIQLTNKNILKSNVPHPPMPE